MSAGKISLALTDTVVLLIETLKVFKIEVRGNARRASLPFCNTKSTGVAPVPVNDTRTLYFNHTRLSTMIEGLGGGQENEQELLEKDDETNFL
jgi:hypothetical protein